MPTNNYFQSGTGIGSTNEQRLIEDLIIESLKTINGKVVGDKHVKSILIGEQLARLLVIELKVGRFAVLDALERSFGGWWLLLWVEHCLPAVAHAMTFKSHEALEGLGRRLTPQVLFV